MTSTLNDTLVRVTLAHIARGEVKDCERCPVALAVLDAISVTHPSAVVEADGDVIKLWLDGGTTWQADTPPPVTEFIGRFDAQEFTHGGPFEFTLTWRQTAEPR